LTIVRAYYFIAKEYMNNQVFSDFISHLAIIGADPALMSSMAAKNPALYDAARHWVTSVEADRPKPVAGPFPAKASITAIQAAVFDNWPQGRPVKGQPTRFGMAIEFWTAPADQIQTARLKNYQRKANVKLLDGVSLTRWITKANKENAGRKNPLGASYLRQLAILADGMQPDERVGMLVDKTGAEGTVYYDFQFIFVRMAEDGVTATLMLADDIIDLAPFCNLQANGQPLRGNVIWQSRNDLCGFSVTWATGGAK